MRLFRSAPASSPASAAAPAKPRTLVQRVLRDWIAPFAFAAAVLAPLRSAVADWNDVPTGSMEPTILPGDRVYVNKLAYGLRVPFTQRWFTTWSNPHRGEIVVFHSPKDGTRLIKRIVGLPGDTVELRNNRLFVNGQACEYSNAPLEAINAIAPTRRADHEFAGERLGPVRHAMMTTPARPALRSFAAVTVPEGEYFVMGDNRDNSADSRFFGTVPRRAIVGRSSAVVLSVDPDRSYTPRFGRWFMGMD